MDYSDLKAMGMHEVKHFDTFTIMRVPNGWIYTIVRLDHDQMNSVFVPIAIP